MRPGVRLNLPEAFRQARVQLRKMGLPSGIHDTVSVLLDISTYHGKGYGCFPMRRTVRKHLVQRYGHTSRTRPAELPPPTSALPPRQPTDGCERPRVMAS